MARPRISSNTWTTFLDGFNRILRKPLVVPQEPMEGYYLLRATPSVLPSSSVHEFLQRQNGVSLSAEYDIETNPSQRAPVPRPIKENIQIFHAKLSARHPRNTGLVVYDMASSAGKRQETSDGSPKGKASRMRSVTGWEQSRLPNWKCDNSLWQSLWRLWKTQMGNP